MGEEDITQLLQDAGSGDASAETRLLERIYDELKRMAASQLRAERSDHTLQPTELVNEAYVRLVPGASGWENRAHFFGSAARAMRRVLVDHARRKAAGKRGAGNVCVTLDEPGLQAGAGDQDVLALDEALTALADHDERLARVVLLRYFAGAGIEQCAELLGVSPATVKRDWAYARAWLHEYLSR